MDRSAGEGGGGVIGAFNRKFDIQTILERNKYERRGNRYLAPDSTSGLPGVYIFEDTGRCYSHHGNDSLNDGHSHDAFSAFCILEHGCDVKAAVKAAAADLGVERTYDRPLPPPMDDAQDYDRLERESIQQEAQELPPDWRGPQASKPEAPKPEQKNFPPLDYATITPTSEALRNPPPPREFLFKNLLPKGIIGEIIAVGGTGKGFLMNLLGLSLATGTKIGLFEPERAFKVACIGAEDDQPELHRRAVWTTYNIWPEGWPPSIDNFIPISVAGEIGPLMRLEGGNPVPAPGYDWLCKSLENLKDIEVLILDPKSMLYGLEENNNDHNTAWVKCLQSIANRTPTFFFSGREHAR